MAKPVALPRTIEIGPFTYTMERSALVAKEHWGACDNDKRILEFGEHTDPKQLPNTFLHELLHALEAGYRLKLTEQQVSVLANGLMQGLQSVGLLPKELILEGDD